MVRGPPKRSLKSPNNKKFQLENYWTDCNKNRYMEAYQTKKYCEHDPIMALGTELVYIAYKKERNSKTTDPLRQKSVCAFLY